MYVCIYCRIFFTASSRILYILFHLFVFYIVPLYIDSTLYEQAYAIVGLKLGFMYKNCFKYYYKYSTHTDTGVSIMVKNLP